MFLLVTKIIKTFVFRSQIPAYPNMQCILVHFAIVELYCACLDQLDQVVCNKPTVAGLITLTHTISISLSTLMLSSANLDIEHYLLLPFNWSK